MEDGRARGRSGSVSAGERDGVIKQQEVDPTIEDYWAEKKRMWIFITFHYADGN